MRDATSAFCLAMRNKFTMCNKDVQLHNAVSTFLDSMIDRGLSSVLGSWRRPSAVRDPGKLVLDLAATLLSAASAAALERAS
jgi:hypothetical protein